MPTTLKCRDSRLRRRVQKIMMNRAHAEALPFFLGGRSGKRPADHPPSGEAADRHANDRQVSGALFASRTSQRRGDDAWPTSEAAVVANWRAIAEAKA